MKLASIAMAVVVAALHSSAEAKVPPLRDPVFLNIGFVCQWRDECMDRQRGAMKRALGYVKKYDPPDWKVQLCNRRAVQRRTGRIDWISFNNCVRNPKIVRTQASARRGR